MNTIPRTFSSGACVLPNTMSTSRLPTGVARGMAYTPTAIAASFRLLREIYPLKEVIADEGELTLTMMTIDTREQRTGRRSSTQPLTYAPGDVLGSLTGELDYDIRDSIPGNVVRSKPLLRKRMPFWYLDLVKTRLSNP